MTEKKNNRLFALFLFGTIGALWRRWFGGGFGKAGKITRFWKYAVLILICFTMYYLADPYFTFWQKWRTYAAVAAFAYHWARSHGDYFYVWSKGKDEGRIKWIDWVLRRIYGKDGYYNFKGNVTGLCLRYGSTSILVALCLNNSLFCLSGLLTPLAYVITGKMGTGKEPIAKAEFLSGALNFALFYLCL